MKKKLIVLILCILSVEPIYSSHLLGGHISARYLGNDQYEITGVYYRDCRAPNVGGGNPQAIIADASFFLSVFTNNGVFYRFDSIQPSNEIIIPAINNSKCGIDNITTCINKITFTYSITLPPNASGGYQIVNQRCCWQDGFINIQNPGGAGQSLICEINTDSLNSTPVYNSDPNFIACVNLENTIDLSASDVDGDSITYSFCPAINGGNLSDPKPFIYTLPQYQNLVYVNPYSGTQPYTHGPFSLNNTTGILKFRPTMQGSFLFSICYTEWRNGTIINTSRRNVAVQITNCTYQNKAIIQCDSITQALSNDKYCISKCVPENTTVAFNHNSIGGTSVLWDFGVSGINTDTSTLDNPTYTFPTNGDYTVTLISYHPDCNDTASGKIHIGDDLFNASFSYNGNLCVNQPIRFDNTSNDTSNVLWVFTDPARKLRLNTVNHNFHSEGEKEVWFHTGNLEGCYASQLQTLDIGKIDIETIEDTLITPGINLPITTTGADSYSWRYVSGNNSVSLNNTNIGNPVATSSTYLFGVNLFEVSGSDINGCEAKDSLEITVAEREYLIVPNAFSPNGDGLNDYLNILTAGYRLDVMRIYNRRGQCVFETNDINMPWDGKFKGQDQGIDAYYWYIQAYNLAGAKVLFKGDVTVIR